MRKTLILFFVICFSFFVNAKEKLFNIKTLSNFYIAPKIESSIIYPVELGKEMTLKQSEGDWFNVVDKETGLIGWVLKEDYSSKKPNKKGFTKNYDQSFKVFKERVIAMSASIKDAISVETFLDVKHLGGAAAVVVAHNDWFKGRRHANQAFQVYEIWKGANQSPSFLSFRNQEDKEQFIILSGPNRPRYLKSNK